jgi:two-component system, response regulator RegA
MGRAKQRLPVRVRTLLVVDDDRDVLKAWRRQLCRMLGFEEATTAKRCLIAVSDAASARARTRTRIPDLAVIDLNLAPGDEPGIDLVRWFRAEYPAMRVAIISGGLPEDVRGLYQDERADLVLPKPVDWARVLACVESETPSPELRTARQAARDHRLWVLAACGGNISDAARELGIPRSQLQRELAAPEDSPLDGELEEP